ncbi:MAG: hypothetical protein GXO81_08700 [Chlorobi bacterium]|nr:hypothetical protein [Chlorobiota bacterium]
MHIPAAEEANKVLAFETSITGGIDIRARKKLIVNATIINTIFIGKLTLAVISILQEVYIKKRKVSGHNV